MNEKYLRGYFDNNILPSKPDASYDEWVSKISSNEDYKRGMFNSHVASKKPDASYDEWNSKVFGVALTPQPSPEKKSPVGSLSQDGSQGLSDGITAPSGGIEVPPQPLVGLGGVGTAEQSNLGAIGQALEAGPKKKDGTYILDGKPISEEAMKSNLQNRSFVKTLLENPKRIDIQGDPVMREFAQRQWQAVKSNDAYDSLMLSIARAGQMFGGAVDYVDDLVSDLTGVPNSLYIAAGSLAGPNAAAAAATGAPKEVVSSVIDKFRKDAETIEQQRFQVEGDFIDLVSKGDFQEAANMAINTTAESAVPSLLIGLGTAVTGGGAGLAALARGGAAVTPLFIGGEYAEQKSQMKDIRERLTESQKFLSTSPTPTRDEIALMNLSKAGQYLRPAARGTAEMGGEALSFGIWKGTAKLATQSMRSLIGKTGAKLGKEAAEEAAKVGAGALAKNLLGSMLVDPAIEGFAELGTYATQELTDVLLGVSTKSPARIMREGLNAWALGAASGGVMTAPGTATTGIVLTGKGLTNAKKYLDNILAFDPSGLSELNNAIGTMRERGQEQQADAIEQNLKKREKAVKAVPKDKVADTETVDKVERKQGLQEGMKDLDPVYQEPIKEEIATIENELREGIRKEYPAPTVNTSPTETKYASVNRNDGKGTIDLTQEEYIAEMERRGTPVEDVTAEVAPTVTVEQTEEVAPAEVTQPTPPTDAVQEQSTESVPVRQQPEARQGVREEDTQGQETPQEGEAQEEVIAEEVAPSRVEIESQLDALRQEYSEVDVFDTEEVERISSEIERLETVLDTFPKEEVEPVEEREFTDEERAAAEEQMEAEFKEEFKGTNAFNEIEEAFQPITIEEFERYMGKGMYKENRKFLTGLVTKDGGKQPIDTRQKPSSQMEDTEFFDPEDIIDFINTVAAERNIKGETRYNIPKERRARRASAPKTPSGKEKVSTGDFLRGLAKEVGKGKISKDVMMSGIPGFTQAWNAAITAAEKSLEATAYISDIVDFLVDHIKNSPQFKALKKPQQKAYDLKGLVIKEMGLTEQQYNDARVEAAKEKGKRDVKEARKEERQKASEKVSKAKETATEKATEKAKQKYVNIGYRIGEAFGKLGGEIRGKAEGRKEGRKEATSIQRQFVKQVEEIISAAVKEAKQKSPGFTVTPNQLAAASKKLLSVNFNSPLSIEKAVEYVDKVLNNATYANDVSRAKKLKDSNRNRLNRNDYGIDDGSMSQSLKVDHEQLSVDELADYLAFLEGISKGPYNKAENLALVEKYAAMYREQKEAVQEPVSEAQEEGNKKRELSRNEAKQEAIDEFEFERATMSAPVSEAYQKDYTFLKSLTEAELDSLSEKQLRELSNAVRNMRDDMGFMSGNASNTIRTIRAERLATEGKKITEDKNFKQLLRDMILPFKVSFKGIQKMTPTEKMKRLISMMPLNRIDAAMKGLTGQAIHDAFLQPISTAFSVFTEKMTQIDKSYDRLYSKVGKSLIPWKREQQRQDEMVKLSLIAIQKEFEANPNNEEVSSLTDYMDAIREAAEVNDDYAKFAERYISIYESMLDSDGNFNYAEQEALLDKDTKAFYDYAQSINADNTVFVEVSAIRNGENVSLRQHYTPISVALIDYSNLSEVQDMANRFSSDENVKPTAQSGNIKKRTKGGKPLYLDFHRNAKRATRSVLLDYYMREPLRVASKAFNKMAKDKDMSAESRAFFKGLEANIAQVVKNTFVNEYYEGGLGTLIAETLKKRGYQMALASIPRAGVEFASNLTHAVINKPKELVAGAKILSEYKGNDEDLRTLAIYAESAQISRMFEKSMSIMSEQGSNTKGSSTAYGRAIDRAADAIMSTPDRAIARPIWLGSFARTFEQVSGSEIDIQKMISDPEYRQKNAAAISAARNVADVNLSQGFASLNPFEGVVASQVTKSDSMIETFDKYMTRFLRYEFQSAADALNGLAGNNELSRTQASALLAATMVRMAAYQFAMSYAVDGFYSLIEAAIGTGPEDDDEKDNEELNHKIGSAVIGSIISMIAFRRLGNWAKAPIAWGIETLNSKFGEEVGLRNGEYDPYENSLVFSPIAGDVQGTDLNSDKLIPKFMGPYGPMAKTAFRAKELLGRTGIQDGMGGYLIEPSSKSQEAIDRANNELAVRIIPEMFMNTVGAPVPRDVRNLIIRDVFKDFKGPKSKEETDLSKSEKELEKEMSGFKEKMIEKLYEKKGDSFLRYEDQSNIGESKSVYGDYTVREYKKLFKDRYGQITAKDLPNIDKSGIRESHNATVLRNKDPKLSKHVLSNDGEGASVKNPVQIASSMHGAGIKELTDEQKTLLRKFYVANNKGSELRKIESELKKLQLK